MKKIVYGMAVVLMLGACQNNTAPCPDVAAAQTTRETKDAVNPSPSPETPSASTSPETLHTPAGKTTSAKKCVPDTVFLTAACDKFALNGYNVPPGLLPAAETFTVFPHKDTTLALGNKGTRLHIPKNAFVDAQGRTVTTPVDIRYTEFRHSAEMAFSGIPMTYTVGGERTYFNSSGMFHIGGSSQGRAVEVAWGKSLTIDYAISKQNPDIDFYRLNDDGGNWKLVSQIQPPEKEKKTQAVGAMAVEAAPPKPGNDSSMLAWIEVTTKKKKSEKFWVHTDTLDKVLAKNRNREMGAGDVDIFVGFNDVAVNQKTDATLLAEGMNAGHTYPDIVKGLNVASFGVYNCDQIYRIPNLITVSPIFYDQNHTRIADGKVLSLIDLNYNGAFSFDPSNFSCNAKGENVLLLFTRSGKLYLLDKGEFAKLGIDRNGRQEFTLREVTHEITSSQGLADYLGIKI